MSTDTAILHRCFEQLGESGADITEAVYDHYTSNLPQVNEHIGYLDNRMRGRMLDQVYRLLINDVDENYLNFEVQTHQCYGATPELYQGLLTAIKETVKSTLSSKWTAQEESAWDESITRIITDIKRINA